MFVQDLRRRPIAATGAETGLTGRTTGADPGPREDLESGVEVTHSDVGLT